MPAPAVPLAQRVRTVSPALSVGILTADLTALGAALRVLEQAGAPFVHFDVMDGRFCPMHTFGPPIVKACRTSLIKDVHLLIEEPLDKLESFVAAGADMITLHLEACRHPHRALQALRTMTNANDSARGILRGVALNPGTPVESVQPLLDETDMVFLLAVNPGWGGQKFIDATGRRMERLRELICQSQRDILMGLDGGITKDNVGDAVRMGADIIVTGSAVFDGKDAAANYRQMAQTVREARKA